MKYVNKPATSVNVSELSEALKNHANQCFLITSFCFLPESSFICNNLQSATKEPDVVDNLFANKVENGCK